MLAKLRQYWYVYTLTFALGFVVGWACIPRVVQAASCTLVLGFSQTNQWYTGGFENYVPSAEWELQYAGGASIDHFVDYGDPVWSAGVISPCGTPDRAVLNVSGDYSTDVAGWASRASQAAQNVRGHYPSVGTIYLQPVVGGPGYGQCTAGNGHVVRASYNAPYIAEAIDSLAGANGLLPGPHATVTSCGHFADDIGHLTDGTVFDYVAQQIAAFYAGATPLPTATPTSTALPTATRTPTATPMPVVFAYRLNAGGPQYTGGDGRVWLADTAYVGTGCGYVSGAAFSSQVTISGTPDQPLYWTNRHDGAAVEYRCALAPGLYTVNLHFAETLSANYGSNRRVFHVSLEGSQVLTNFDPYATAGPATAIVRTFQVQVSDGVLNVVAVPVAGHAEINALEVLSVAQPTAQPTATATMVPATPTSTPTSVPTPSPTLAPTDTPQPTATPTALPTATATATLVLCRVWVSVDEGPGQWASCDGTH